MDNEHIKVKGAWEHNLQGVSALLPKFAIIAITGVSGSGKSSFAYDTIHAEGQRRYLEYLSPDIRSRIKQLPKPHVESIEGLSPTLATGHHHLRTSSHTTVSSQTDIYDFMSLLFSKIGEQHSPATGKKLTRYTRHQISFEIEKRFKQGTRIQLIAPISLTHENLAEAVKRLYGLGFVRVRIDGVEYDAEEGKEGERLEVIVDRLVMQDGIHDRLSESITTAMDLSQGVLMVQEGKEGPIHYYTEIYVCPESGMSFPPLTPQDFNPRSKNGACPLCKGRGNLYFFDETKVSWKPKESFYWQIDTVLEHFPPTTRQTAMEIVKTVFDKEGIVIDTPYNLIPENLKKSVLFGTDPSELPRWKGIKPLISEEVEAKGSRSKYRSMLFVKKEMCDFCKGYKLKPECLFCLINGKGIHEWDSLSVEKLYQLVTSLSLPKSLKPIADEIIPEILSRLSFLEKAGLGYLELNRSFQTLSDGEAARVQLASLIGAKLSGILYILDEPSRGLHPTDTKKLGEVIGALKNLGNSVLLVEHNRILIDLADSLLEFGPGAGIHGGQIIFSGKKEEMIKDPSSPTGKWLSNKESYPFKTKEKKPNKWLHVEKATCHNLHDFTAKLPLGCMLTLSGVSGSGKSTLAEDIIGKEVSNWLKGGEATHISGIEQIKNLTLSSEQIVSATKRSIPATYIGVMDSIRELYASTKLAKARGYTSSRFSLNKRGGRCDACQGLGQIKVSMEIMTDITIPCDLCNGNRYNFETLQVTWNNFSIADVLALTAEEAMTFFKNIPKIHSKLKLMTELGLDYLPLGQSLDTLSGGELQRLKLISDLAGKEDQSTLYILDEPSSGLHFQDVQKLLKIFKKLVQSGHSLIIIEHNIDIIAQSDWVIELGPGGGPGGGNLIFSGTPSSLANANTPTGNYLKEIQ